MSKRQSIYIDGISHRNPIPPACRLGNLVMTSLVVGRDEKTGELPKTLDEQCANLFRQVRTVVEAAGGTIDDIIKMNIWLRDANERGPLNHEWLAMFPDPQDRPARQTLQMELTEGHQVQADFIALIGS